jgi:hypothetical protein
MPFPAHKLGLVSRERLLSGERLAAHVSNDTARVGIPLLKACIGIE